MKVSVQGKAAYAYTGGKAFDPTLPCITFVHGAMNDHGVWNLLARWFAHHGHSVLAVDLPGHMRSAGPALASVEAQAQWLEAFLQTVGVRRTALVGHSMGSLVALELAASGQAHRRLVDVSHLVMVGSCVPMPVPQALLDLSQRDVSAAIERVVSFSFSSLGAKPSFPGPGMWVRGAARGLMHMVAKRALSERGDAALFHTDFSACNAYVKGLEAAALVKCPAHVILGRHDQMTLPRAATAVAQALRAQVHTLEAGHFIMQDAPDQTLAALRLALG
jgi:pimeloyl-ACP methyl ester carboxylesterase